MPLELKTARSVVFEVETLGIVGKYMSEKNKNFSKAVNLLIKQGDYLGEKVKMLRKERQLNGQS